MGMAALRLGFLTAYLSPPLTSGYTTASALYIATSQLPSLFGVPSVRYEGPLALFYSWGVRRCADQSYAYPHSRYLANSAQPMCAHCSLASAVCFA